MAIPEPDDAHAGRHDLAVATADSGVGGGQPAAADVATSSNKPTRRLKLTLAYRGSAYFGWQTQFPSSTWKGPTPAEGHGIPTIQERLRRAVISVVRHPVTISGSSRTDARVHAKGQVAHFDTEKVDIPLESIRRAVNNRLPEDILIRRIEEVPDGFDAVGWTISKRYQYGIWHAFDRPVFSGDLWWHRWQELDVPAMTAAAAHFVGSHDFTSFAKPGHGRESTVRTVYECSVSYRKPRLVIAVHGNGFLWQMIRIMVGTIVEVGLGRYGPERIPEMFAACDRRAGGPTAPPQGLYLQWIQYPPDERGGPASAGLSDPPL